MAEHRNMFITTLTAAPVEYCPGFVDENGIWNNGFPCPKNTFKKYSPHEHVQYCCGTERKRFCCPQNEPADHDATGLHKSVALVVGLVVGFAVLTVAVVLLVCYRCHCCILHKRRKHQHHQAINGYSCSCRREPSTVINRTTRDGHTLTYTVCSPSHQHSYQGYLEHHQLEVFPAEDPPPYPEALLVAKETQTGYTDTQYDQSCGPSLAHEPDVAVKARLLQDRRQTHPCAHTAPSSSRKNPSFSTFRTPEACPRQQRHDEVIHDRDNEHLLADTTGNAECESRL